MSEPNADPNLQTDSFAVGKRPWYMAPDGLVAKDGLDPAKDMGMLGAQILTEAQTRDLAKGAGLRAIEITYAKASGMPKIMLVKAFK